MTTPDDPQRSYDVIVIGAGPAGENAAARAVRGGLSAAIIEAELVGGECSYWACIPSKALLRPVETAAATRRLPGLQLDGVAAGEVLARRDKFVSRRPDSSHDDSGQADWVAAIPADLLRGHGRLAGERRVAVTAPDGQRTMLTARQAVVLATGTTAAVPDIPGLRAARPWISRDATNLTAVPERLVVLGGGVVACEMGQALRGLGAAEVTMISRGRLLERMEPWVGELLAEALREDGIRIRFGELTAVTRRVDGTVRVGYAGPDGSGEVSGDEVLCALGRRPATADLGLDSVGLRPGEYVKVDDTLRSVQLPWLYAVGDVNGRALLTHQGKYQARVCGDAIAARAAGRPAAERARTAYADDRMVPQVVFTDPQCASVGLTAEQARRRGFPVRVVDYELGSVSGAALLADDYRGRASMVVDSERRVLLGVTFVGQDVAELLHSATVAVVAEVPLELLWHAVPAFPTVSEVWLRLLESYGL